MANTKIQIKRSTVSSAPTTLDIGELAYSYSSNTLYIGNTAGSGVLAIGGLSSGVSINAYVQSVGTAGNNYTNSVGTAGNNYASILAANNALAGNNYTNFVGLSANSYAGFMANSVNSFATAMDTAGNNYTNFVGLSANSYAGFMANSVNSFATAMDTAGNNYTNSVGLAGNNYTNAVGAASNNYSNSTFVRLTASSQTITGDLALTGNLIFLGNATSIVSNNLIVGDSLIYLAANNYSGTDILDIGFVANYANGTGANVHTGLIRDATTKQYYLFQGLDIELQGNNTAFVAGANGAVNAILNADIIANQITLGGINVQPWITAAFTVANSSNGWANTVGVAGNNYTNFVGLSANSYAGFMANSVNSFATAMDTAGNNYASILVANNAIGANAWSNTKTANVFGTSGRVTAAYTTTGGLNNVTIDLATTTVTPSTYGGSGTIPFFTVDAYGRLTAAGNTGINVGSVSGTLAVGNGGTGNTSLTANGILIGKATSPVTTLYSSTEGHVLQVSSTGAPQYAMLDGGSF